MLALWIRSYYQCSIGFIASAESNSWQELSQTSWTTHNSAYKNNITLRNADWHDNASQVFDYHQTQESKYNYDMIMQSKRFNNHCIHNHDKGKEIKYGTLVIVSSTYTKTLVAFWSSNTENSSNNIDNNNSNNKIINNSNMSDIIIEYDSVIELHINVLSGNEHNKINEKRHWFNKDRIKQ